jgi:hypothetical protein
MKGYMYCEWKVNKTWHKGFIEYSRVGQDIPLDKIRALNGPHSKDTVKDFISMWGWGKLEHNEKRS